MEDNKMSILIDETKKILVQGISGREGKARTKLMIDYGTQVVAGVTPGKGGEKIYDVPVFDTVIDAINNVGTIDISVIFVPAPIVKNSALEAIEAGIKLLILIPDRVPLYDVLEITEASKSNGSKFIGPNTLGVLSPGKAVVGMIGGRAESAKSWFKQGNIGVSSRSGGISSSIAYYLSKENVGLSTIVHVGGDSIVGMSHPDIMRLFEQDPQTKAVVMFGEIGTSQEERVADMIQTGVFTKPLIAYIGGRTATEGTRFSHAGAIIEGDRGTYKGKIKRLQEVGAYIVENFNDIPSVTKEVLNSLNKGDKR